MGTCFVDKWRNWGVFNFGLRGIPEQYFLGFIFYCLPWTWFLRRKDSNDGFCFRFVLNVAHIKLASSLSTFEAFHSEGLAVTHPAQPVVTVSYCACTLFHLCFAIVCLKTERYSFPLHLQPNSGGRTGEQLFCIPHFVQKFGYSIKSCICHGS